MRAKMWCNTKQYWITKAGCFRELNFLLNVECRRINVLLLFEFKTRFQ